MNQEIIKSDAKSVIDMLFETKSLKPDLTRDHLNALEEFVSFILQSRLESYTRHINLTKKLDETIH